MHSQRPLLLLVVVIVVLCLTTTTILAEYDGDWSSLDTSFLFEQQQDTIIVKTQVEESTLSNITSTYSKQTCFSNPKSHTSTKFLQVMNGCHMDQTNNKILFNLSTTMVRWFNPTVISETIFLFILVLPWFMSVYDDEQKTSENMARYAYYTIHACALLFRIAWTAGVGSWLLAVFRQSSPCACSYDIYRQTTDGYGLETNLIATTDPVTYSYAFGMPSTYVLVASILALHAIERFSYVFGIAILLLAPVSAVFAGIASTGQVITSFAISLPLHIYQTRTPMWLRFLDFGFNLVGGFLVFPLVKHFYTTTDFTFSLVYFEGIIMQVFAFMVIVLIFSFGFTKIIVFYRLYSPRDTFSSPLDIQHLHLQLVPDRSDLNEGEQQGYDHGDYNEKAYLRGAAKTNGYVFSILYNKRYVLYGLAFLTALLIVALRVSGHHINAALSFGKDLSN
jgi:hypothetical protein